MSSKRDSSFSASLRMDILVLDVCFALAPFLNCLQCSALVNGGLNRPREFIGERRTY